MSSAPIQTHGSIVPLSTRDQLHIAVAQLLPDPSGLHHTSRSVGSLEKLEQCAHQAAQAGADIVVFPEYFLSGATHGHWHGVRGEDEDCKGQDDEDGDQEERGWLETIKETAKRADIDIVAGTVVEVADGEEQEREGRRREEETPHRLDKARSRKPLYNTAYYVSHGGDVLHRYTKQNLWHPERATLSSSSPSTHAEQHRSATFGITTRRGLRLRASMAICWDLAWYSRFEQMLTSRRTAESASDLDVEGQAAGPDVILVPTCWYASDGGAAALRWNRKSEEELLRNLCATRALETESVLVMCNVAGPRVWQQRIDALLAEAESGQTEELPLIGLGRSLIAAPFKGCVARIEHEHEALLLQSVDLGILREAREVYRNRYDAAEKLRDAAPPQTVNG